ncbi:MAG: hypothetical protein AAB393_05315, partial [Bacteroidota bacterium]
MIKNYDEVRKFEEQFLSEENLTVKQRFAILEGLYKLAVRFGHFKQEDIMEGIENDIWLAKALNT